MREPSYHPAHSYMETGARRIGRIRRQTANRMRDLRQRWRDVGRPDPATLDRAVVDALRDAVHALVVDGVVVGTLDPADIIRRTAHQLVERTQRAKEAGKEGVVYDRNEVADALRLRLLSPPKAGVIV